MASDDLDRLRAMVEAAWPGPWDGTDDLAGNVYGPRVPGVDTNGLVAACYGEPNANAELIAALRNVASELLAVAEAAEPWDTRERCSPGCACAPCRLGDALAALRAKLREVV